MDKEIHLEERKTPASPFSDEAYRQWEREFERNIMDKALPPLPDERDPRSSVAKHIRSEEGSARQHEEPQGNIQGGKFPSSHRYESVHRNSWERRAEKVAGKRKAGARDSGIEQLIGAWSPAMAEEDKTTKCCCVM